ncbi:hypothetical protein [Tetragenococcus halophilus]|uniref:hypothetical protein n=1 Tax=Tetragenococcus halophilus TaxID=51669 RepID=UPI001B5913D0|nr:hypothetical protein [Tetragenococcus halophilus]GFK24921.1 hypothetical protein YA163_19840 [Tetragenococcus halophilus]
MGMFLFLIGILGIVGSIIWLIIGLFKRAGKKKAAMLFAISIVIMVIGAVNSPSSESNDTASANTTKQTTGTESSSENQKAKENKKEADSVDVKTINSSINDHLRENQGFAKGTIDENGEETDNGTPNPEFDWATTIDKIQYDGESTVVIFVNDDFMNYDKSEAQSVLNKAQNVAYNFIGEDQNWDDEEYRRGLPTNVKHGDSKIATTKTLNPKEFKWKE